MPDNSCIPQQLPLEALDWLELMEDASEVGREIARFDGALINLINPAVLLAPLTSQEAVLSSRIEGTQASLTEVLDHEAGENFFDEKKKDINEILNYRLALLNAEESIADRPLSLHLIRDLHRILMQDVRGSEQTPGEFRTTQNWIGRPGSAIEDARFIPPSPLIMRTALDNLETYMGLKEKDPLVQMAVLHAQFEIIHPFNDGNGRLGRMLIPLFLYQKKVLQRPVFYLSEMLERHDAQYRDLLLEITENGAWKKWIIFFLSMLDQQAKENTVKVKLLNQLYDQMKDRFREATKSQFSTSALDAFFSRPILNTPDFMSLTSIENRGTGNLILKMLLEAGLLYQLRPAKGRRPATYVLPDLINIVEGREVFEQVATDQSA